ncbi:unnamed protein product, partial [Discosporangium mesarthrocarpum]
NIYSRVHVDEKWFRVMREWGRIYLHPSEDIPNPPTAQSERFIKIPFLVSVAIPWLLSNRVWLNGKIGIWLFIETIQAKYFSKNRAAGATVIRPVNMDEEEYKEMIDDIIPAIKSKMPGAATCPTFVQQDGAKSHTKDGIVGAIEEAGEGICLETHAASSPDLNVVNLGNLHSIPLL